MMLFDFSLLGPPLFAGILVLCTHVPLGREVLSRGIIFIDLAVAQLAGLGVILIHVFNDEPQVWLIQLSAFITALFGSLGLRWAERYWAKTLEAIIGIVFVLSVTAALMILNHDPHGAERLKELLSGQLLWVTYDDLWMPIMLTLGILMACFKWNALEKPTFFYIIFALSVTTSVQLVGVYLVFASLIIPALATRLSGKLLHAWSIGFIGYVLGLTGSVYSDLPTGPLVVWTMTLIAMLYFLSVKLYCKRTN